MKFFLIAALALVQVSAFASRVPRVHCFSTDGSVEVKVYTLTYKEPFAVVGLFNGRTYDKVAEDSVSIVRDENFFEYNSNQFQLSIKRNANSNKEANGKFKFAMNYYAKPLSMVCKF